MLAARTAFALLLASTIATGCDAFDGEGIGPEGGVVVSEDGDGARRKKTPFNKRQLDKFRTVLLQKRAALIGDVSQLEGEALQSQEGSVTTNHIAEQGSDNYDQSLSLDLAAADRKLIKEIDDALAKIADRTYGLCELTGKPIRPERLEELPWARYSIDAARELERRSMP